VACPAVLCEVDDAELVAWSMSQNLHRRHMSTSQRAVVAARIANLEWGDVRSQSESSIELSSFVPVTQLVAAKMLGVSTATVKRAQDALKHCPPEIARAVEAGEMTVCRAMKHLPQPEKKLKRKSKPRKERPSVVPQRPPHLNRL
jgi:hypothetical protein